MAEQTHSDVVSDDGSWGSVYDDDASKAQDMGITIVNQGENTRDVNVSSAPAVGKNAPAERAEQADTAADTMMQDVSQDIPTLQAQDIETTSDVKPTAVEMPGQSAIMQSLNTSAMPTSQNMQTAEEPSTTASATDAQQEFEFDSTDSDDTSSSDSSSSDDSDEEYTMLDPAAAARMLMEDEAYDSEGEAKNARMGAKSYRPRTLNEEEEVAPPRPDVSLTHDMKIPPLGNIEAIVEDTILIKGFSSGEYEVLEPGSLLCTPELKVIGLIYDTFGRVQEPLYSVLLGKEHNKLIEELNLNVGGRVLYVDAFSTTVFTKSLKGDKGTDASNIHDEEVDFEELDFSDDEKEAAYRKMRKQAKQKGQGKLTRAAFQHENYPSLPARPSRAPQPGSSRHQQVPSKPVAKSVDRRAFHPAPVDHTYTIDRTTSGRVQSDRTYLNYDVPDVSRSTALNYDDEKADDEPYQPLKRPDDLVAMMEGTIPQPPPPSQSGQRGGYNTPGYRGRGSRGRGTYNGRGGSHNTWAHNQSQATWSNAPAFAPQVQYQSPPVHYQQGTPPNAYNPNAFNAQQAAQPPAFGFSSNQFAFPSGMPPAPDPAVLAQWFAMQQQAQNKNQGHQG